MTTSDSFGYPPEDSAQSDLVKSMADSQLRELLAELISSSTDLNIRVWLDGIYTDIESSRVQRDWMKGREVYFKVEGKVDSPEKPEERSKGVSQ